MRVVSTLVSNVKVEPGRELKEPNVQQRKTTVSVTIRINQLSNTVGGIASRIIRVFINVILFVMTRKTVENHQ